MVYWPGDAEHRARLYFPAATELLALDAASGELDETFGAGGRIEIGPATAAPAIAGERLIVTSNSPASVRAFDVRDGRALWRTPLTAQDSRTAGASPWGGFSVDIARNLAFVTTGNPKPSLYGASRPGDNEHANSVVALDLASGDIAWSWQEVAHDLWNLDIPAPPSLATIEVRGTRIDVVAVPTKAGNTLLLERDSGRPIFDYRLRRAPASEITGETTASYQPDLVLPEPFASTAFGPADLTDIGAPNRASIQFQTEHATGGFFAPATLGRELILFGLHGGAEWPGGAIDPEAAALFVPVNRIPWKIRIYLRSRDQDMPPGEGRDLYQSLCASCHGKARQGDYRQTREADYDYVPSLVGTTRIASYAQSYQAAYLDRRHRSSGAPSFRQKDLDVVAQYFRDYDDWLSAQGLLTIGTASSQLIDHERYPGSKPPWGKIVRLDLNTGRIDWQTPFGEYDELTKRGVPITGQPNYGGLMVTRGHLLFATGTIDGRLRAFDSETGTELWSFALPAAGSAPPLTYQVDGRQYVAVVSSGGRFHNFDAKASQITAFALPR
jgi:quinoprotein glucose dehydrogenase